MGSARTCSRLLQGWRGKPSANVATVVSAIARIADFATAHASEIEDLDVNPLIVTPDRAIAVDVLLRLREP